MPSFELNGLIFCKMLCQKPLNDANVLYYQRNPSKIVCQHAVCRFFGQKCNALRNFVPFVQF